MMPTDGNDNTRKQDGTVFGQPEKQDGTVFGSLDTAAWKLLILNLEDVNARIYGRFSLFLISAV
ncbi:hypothetical protein LTSEMON_0488 [Salmonella enterica subsp. enterica serovar Montevideo str. S5-403]|uniref:Uncharacterized protein n=1 Tax=Salmonella enterica subsp. enterica serovar Montevideo str. S5-403 TaxID=913242 RepID=G5PYK3_SALMO|nr:hypothetical protein LTSEMON_0488 [Salmonella enterica subsp. enterica serovar Montevideo str. S5-403]